MTGAGGAGGRAASAPLLGRDTEPTLFELSQPGRRAWQLPHDRRPRGGRSTSSSPPTTDGPSRSELAEVSERDLVAHFTRLSHRQFSVDLGAYPLGSCTMKYNPKICDAVAALPGSGRRPPGAHRHRCTQGWLELLVELEESLCEITGMAAATLQPAAGRGRRAHRAAAHAGLARGPAARYAAQGDHPRLGPRHQPGVGDPRRLRGGDRAERRPRAVSTWPRCGRCSTRTWPGSCSPTPTPSGSSRRTSSRSPTPCTRSAGSSTTTVPTSTPSSGVVRPGDMGFDIVHLNLHKTFATPHGGGGPGAGPVAVSERLAPVPPRSPCRRWSATTAAPLRLDRAAAVDRPGALLARQRPRARPGPRLHPASTAATGCSGWPSCAVLNANWLRKRLSRRPTTSPTTARACTSASCRASRSSRSTGCKALDVAKRLLEEGFHSPTVYFPLIVDEALMIEPTETESLQTLEALARRWSGSPRIPTSSTLDRPPGRPRSRGWTRREPRARSCRPSTLGEAEPPAESDRPRPERSRGRDRRATPPRVR